MGAGEKVPLLEYLLLLQRSLEYKSQNFFWVAHNCIPVSRDPVKV